MIRRSLLPLAALLCLTLSPAIARADFGFVPGSFRAVAENEDGTIAQRAGSHPYSYSVSFAFNVDSEGDVEGGEPRDIIVELPPGFVGNPQAVPRCTRHLFEGVFPKCPLNTQVGVLDATLPGIGEVTIPIFNLEPSPGLAGQLGGGAVNLNVLQNASVGSAEAGYGLTVGAFNVPNAVSAATETIWGLPADQSHDAERGQPAIDGGAPVKSDASRLPFLTLPTSCAAPQQITIRADSKLAPGLFVEETISSTDAGGNPVALVGCEAVPFAPTIFATPTSQQASSPSGLDFELELPNHGWLDPEAIAESVPERTEVLFPPGLVINPSASTGLDSCSPAQYADETATSAPGQGCPGASKIGTLMAASPLLKEPVEGEVYVANPFNNPFNSLFALYLVARARERGLLIKQAGQVRPDPQTGQLYSSFAGLPPLPYSSFKLHFREGARAPLTTPSACGGYETIAQLIPFSAPGAPAVARSGFQVDSGAGGALCPPGGAGPFAPTFSAGTNIPIAGAYSPMVFNLSREHGSQRLSVIDTTLPKGLLGKLAGVTQCSEGQIAAAQARVNPNEGKLEQASPSCPIGSEVGIVNVGAGSGTPTYVQGRAYMAGAYKGAPLSLAIITPAVVGPFDLGVVVARVALYVDETTAQIRAVSDPLPTILQGVPVDIRSVSLEVTRPNFILNPTNCDQMAFFGTATSTIGQLAQLSDRFQVGSCDALSFKPKLTLKLSGGTKRNQHPALKAVVTYPKGSYANIARAAVTLPAAEFIDPNHVNNPCTRAQYAAGACPSTSVLGKARVFTPLLDKPLEGPVYFRSNGGVRELPDVVAVLDGQIRFVLVGFVDSVVKKGTEVSRIRNTFASTPDAPVSKVVFELAGGKKKGVLVNSANLCSSKTKTVALARFKAQNGKTHNFAAPVATDCVTKKKSAKARPSAAPR